MKKIKEKIFDYIKSDELLNHKLNFNLLFKKSIESIITSDNISKTIVNVIEELVYNINFMQEEEKKRLLN